MERKKLIDHYLERTSEKNFEIIQIRRELEAHKIPDEEIRTIVRIVDNEVQRRARVQTQNQLAQTWIWMGLVLASIGAGITIATYTGIIPTGNSFLIVYGPFLPGTSILLAGLAKRRR